MNDRVVIFTLIGALLILLVVMFSSGRNKNIRIDELNNDIAQNNPFDSIHLTAKAAIVWDISRGKSIFALNSNEALPLASLTKAMTALTAALLVPDYTVVNVRKEFLEEEGDAGLLVDERWVLKDLLTVSLTTSSNDAARAVAAVAGSVILDGTLGNSQDEEMARSRFVYEMNELAKTIGLGNTRFINENGLDADEIESGAYGSARDVAALFEYILRHKGEIFEPTKYESLNVRSLNNIDHDIRNTNLIIKEIPGLLGSKTGFTDLAGGNVAIALDPGLEGPYIIVVLGSTQDGRFADLSTLVGATMEYVTNVK